MHAKWPQMRSDCCLGVTGASHQASGNVSLDLEKILFLYYFQCRNWWWSVTFLYAPKSMFARACVNIQNIICFWKILSAISHDIAWSTNLYNKFLIVKKQTHLTVIASTVPAYGLALLGGWPSAGTVMTYIKSCICYYRDVKWAQHNHN